MDDLFSGFLTTEPLPSRHRNLEETKFGSSEQEVSWSAAKNIWVVLESCYTRKYLLAAIICVACIQE